MDDRRRVAETGRDPVAGKIIETIEIAARHGAAVEVKRGQVVRVIDVEGAQVGDLVCFNRHDCSDEYYRNRLDHHEPHRSCRGNLAEAVAPWGVAPRDIPFSFNVFMRWPVQPDGAVVPMAAPSGAGDYADFLAEMDVVVANSACPSDITPTNAHHPTPMRLVVYEPSDAR